MSELTRTAYTQIVRDDIEWLMKQPRTLEREHIKMVVEHSVDAYYGDATEREQRLREALGAALPQLHWANTHGSRCEELIEQARAALAPNER